MNTIEPNTGSPSTNYTDSTVEPETTYHYAVQALSQDGNGARSITSVTTPAEPEETVQNDPPAAPTGLTAAQVTHDSLTLTWDDPQDANITGYRVLRGTSADGLSTIEEDTASTSAQYTDSTVAAETTYHYAVTALSADGDSPQSGSTSATTPEAPKSKDPPPQRVGPRAAAAGAPAITAPNAFRVPAVLSVDLSSITDTEGTTGIADNATYKWQRFNAAGTTLDTDSIGTVSTYTLTDADANKRLKVVVSFIDDAGNSEGPLTSAAAGILAAATDCNAPTLTGGATFLGSARKMAVGKISFLGHLTIGFLKTSGSGTLDNAAFTTAGSNNYEIVGIANTNNFVVRLDTDLTAADKSTLVLHICDQAYAFGSSSSSNADYQFHSPSQDWQRHAERTIYLSQDTVAPTFTWATVNGTSLVITLSEDLGAAASLDNTDFAVKKNGSTTPLSTTAPVILGNTVTLTLTTAVAATDTNVLVTYTKPTSGTANKLMDRFGNQVETFTDEDAVQHQALVSNIGQANNSGTASTTHDLAQAFTTGANDTGYTLTSIDMFLWSLNGSATPPTVTLHSGSASGTKVADFTGPSTIGPGDVSYTFIPATPVTLNASTEYWVVAEGATSYWNNTFSETEDGSGAPGWTIADLGQSRPAGTGNFADQFTTSYQLRINGTVNPPPVLLVSNLSQTADQNATYSRDHGQAFTTGSNSTGYTVTSVTIVSTDTNDGAIPLQICEVDGSVHPTTVCTNLTPPSSYPQGNLTYIVPTTTPLTLDADTTYMLVFKAPPSPTVLRVAATSSDDQDATSLTGFSIANVFQWYNNSDTWVIANGGNAIRITITGVVNPNPATGAPTISGLLEAGQTLTASTTSIADPDGLPSTFNYQWKRYAADGTTFEADIGTDASTYTLTAAEEGKKVLVEVSFTDNAGNREGPLVSAVTLPIIPASVVLVSNTEQGDHSSIAFDVNSMFGQAFIAGNNPTGYTFTSVTIISEDPQGDDLALELCEIGTDGNTPENCTVLTPPASFTSGPLFFYAPTGSTLTLSNGSTYMVVFKSPGGQRVDVDGTLSDGEDASSLHNWSIHDKTHFEGSNGWLLSTSNKASRIGIRGIVNLTAPGAPTDLLATARGSTKINLSWTAPDSTGGTDITGYKIESSSDAGSNWTDLVAETDNTNTVYQHTGLSRGNTRHYRVSAINSVGTSAPSNTANATTATVTDTTAPTVTSMTHQNPASSPTNSDSLTWRVTFSEAVENVDPADFVITGTTPTLTVTPVTSMTGVYDVTASGGDLDSLDGTVTLAFAADQNIVDPSDNTLTATTPTGANDPTFELDNTVPTFVSGTANGTLIVMTFSEELDPNSLPQASSFSISALSSLSVPEPVANSVSIEGTMVTLTVAPAFITDHIVQVYNNAHQGAGGVPLQDAAGNAVQPATTVGHYSVTNETPIGPPASLTAEAGDGRVRLVWTGPAGTSQLVGYQYRYAAGTSVPEETDWTRINSTENLTLLLSGLANGTPHTFELRGVRDSEVGATATVSATPLAAVCSTPDLGDRREVWSATLTVGRYTDSPIGRTIAGYSSGVYGSLGQNGDRIIIGGASYTIDYLYTTLGGEGIRNNIFMALDNSKMFTSAVRGSLRFHWCSDSSGFDNSNDSRYRVSHHHEADWSLYDTRELALSLPTNNDATGTPDITGRALTGQTLKAGTADIADADGLPQNTSDFAWQWIRIADGTETTIQEAISSTYTLTDDDAGKQIKVVVNFTDSLSGAESVTSDAYPSSSTVQRVLVSNIGQTEITENNDAGELAILDAAQEFTTGSNETGYTLSSIDLELTVASTSNFPVVKLFSGSATGTEVATLTAPTNASTGKTTYTFTTPTAITLEGDTSYWVMAETGGGTWHTVSFAEDATPAPDWSIADGDEFRVFSSTDPFTTDTLVALMIRVNGTVNNPFLENFRAEAGNAQVTLRWDNPRDSSITKYQYRQRLTSESAWNPDWTDIPGSRASTTSYTVRNLANRAAYTFEIRAVRGNEPTSTSTASATPEGPPTAPLAPPTCVLKGRTNASPYDGTYPRPQTTAHP